MTATDALAAALRIEIHADLVRIGVKPDEIERDLKRYARATWGSGVTLALVPAAPTAEATGAGMSERDLEREALAREDDPAWHEWDPNLVPTNSSQQTAPRMTAPATAAGQAHGPRYPNLRLAECGCGDWHPVAFYMAEAAAQGAKQERSRMVKAIIRRIPNAESRYADVLAILAAPDAASAGASQEHDASPYCWCHPYQDTVEPLVWIHRKDGEA